MNATKAIMEYFKLEPHVGDKLGSKELLDFKKACEPEEYRRSVGRRARFWARSTSPPRQRDDRLPRSRRSDRSGYACGEEQGPPLPGVLRRHDRAGVHSRRSAGAHSRLSEPADQRGEVVVSEQASRALAPFPTETQLQKMGFVRCETQPCSTFINPLELKSGRCQRHHQEQRSKRRERPLAEVRFAPRSDRRAT